MLLVRPLRRNPMPHQAGAFGLLRVFCLLLFLNIAAAQSQLADGSALCDFYIALTANPAKSSLTNWCVGSAPYSPCGSSGTSTWTGVKCGTVGGASRLVSLDVSSRGLVGSLHSNIGNMDTLTYLNLNFNGFIGNIPSQLWSLRDLLAIPRLYL